VLARSPEVASIKAAATPPTVALPVSVRTGDVRLAGDGRDRHTDRAAAIGLLVDAFGAATVAWLLRAGSGSLERHGAVSKSALPSWEEQSRRAAPDCRD
jgi:hypothetical protein